MGTTVFFSWQADTPTGTGRNFLRKALEDACEAIAADATVDDAHRGLAVDSDTVDDGLALLVMPPHRAADLLYHYARLNSI
jgi:hypothetical protein